MFDNQFDAGAGPARMMARPAHFADSDATVLSTTSSRKCRCMSHGIAMVISCPGSARVYSGSGFGHGVHMVWRRIVCFFEGRGVVRRGGRCRAAGTLPAGAIRRDVRTMTIGVVVTKIDPIFLRPMRGFNGSGGAYRLQYAGPEVRLGSRRVV